VKDADVLMAVSLAATALAVTMAELVGSADTAAPPPPPQPAIAASMTKAAPHRINVLFIFPTIFFARKTSVRTTLVQTLVSQLINRLRLLC